MAVGHLCPRGPAGDCEPDLPSRRPRASSGGLGSLGLPVRDGLTDRRCPRQESSAPIAQLPRRHSAGSLPGLGPWRRRSAQDCRREFRRLAPKTALAVKMSGLNQQDLIDAEFRNTIVIQVLFDPDGVESASCTNRPSLRIRSRRQEGGAQLAICGPRRAAQSPARQRQGTVGSIATFSTSQARLHLRRGHRRRALRTGHASFCS